VEKGSLGLWADAHVGKDAADRAHLDLVQQLVVGAIQRLGLLEETDHALDGKSVSRGRKTQWLVRRTSGSGSACCRLDLARGGGGGGGAAVVFDPGVGWRRLLLLLLPLVLLLLVCSMVLGADVVAVTDAVAGKRWGLDLSLDGSQCRKGRWAYDGVAVAEWIWG
jgi:hypothetical protein